MLHSPTILIVSCIFERRSISAWLIKFSLPFTLGKVRIFVGDGGIDYFVAFWRDRQTDRQTDREKGGGGERKKERDRRKKDRDRKRWH